MRARRTVGIILLVILASVTNVYAHKAEQVRRELQSQGYDQIKFKRTKPPFWVDACLGAELLHLHVDFYGKVTKKTVTGPCPGRDTPDAATISPEAAPLEDATVNENSSISTVHRKADKGITTKAAETSDAEVESKATKSGECKRYFPATGMTHTVPCD